MQPSRVRGVMVVLAGAAVLLAGAGPRTALGEDGVGLRIGQAEVKPKAEKAIRLATYNVENLFDDHDDPELMGDFEDLDDTKPKAELEALAATIRRLDADVLALQEIESNAALEAFRDTYLKDMGYEHMISIDSGDERGIENAVLSRFPVSEPRLWPGLDLGGTHPDLAGDRANPFAGEPLVYKRSPLVVTVDVPQADGAPRAYQLTLAIVHHKSGRGYDYWREAEAKLLLSMLKELQALNPRRNFAVLGDFNAIPGDESVQMYRRAGFNPPCGEANADDPTQRTHASDRVIDMILIDANLAKEIVPASCIILGTPQIPRELDWRTTPKPEGYASDHLPVSVDLVPLDVR